MPKRQISVQTRGFEVSTLYSSRVAAGFRSIPEMSVRFLPLKVAVDGRHRTQTIDQGKEHFPRLRHRFKTWQTTLEQPFQQ